jgi:hypothetical protein
MSKKRTFEVLVTATKYDRYEVEAESHDEAEKIARERFMDEYGGHSTFDDFGAVAECDECDECDED